MKIVVSQSMYFPWVGLLEQIRLADLFVHYDDVQLTRGFYNRVQIKTQHGMKWLTVPLQKHARETNIEAVKVAPTDWREQHRAAFLAAYRGAPYLDDSLAIMDRVFSIKTDSLSVICRASIIELSSYFGITSSCRFEDSARLGIGGRGSQRLLDIVRHFGGTTYVTGHGARNYLDESIFTSLGVSVDYMNYRRVPYAQLHGEFTPYVTALDLVANCGSSGEHVICSSAQQWDNHMKIE